MARYKYLWSAALTDFVLFFLIISSYMTIYINCGKKMYTGDFLSPIDIWFCDALQNWQCAILTIIIHSHIIWLSIKKSLESHVIWLSIKKYLEFHINDHFITKGRHATWLIWCMSCSMTTVAAILYVFCIKCIAWYLVNHATITHKCPCGWGTLPGRTSAARFIEYCPFSFSLLSAPMPCSHTEQMGLWFPQTFPFLSPQTDVSNFKLPSALPKPLLLPPCVFSVPPLTLI